MQVLGIVGSMRKDKYTALLVNQVIVEIREDKTFFPFDRAKDLAYGLIRKS